MSAVSASLVAMIALGVGLLRRRRRIRTVAAKVERQRGQSERGQRNSASHDSLLPRMGWATALFPGFLYKELSNGIPSLTMLGEERSENDDWQCAQS
jgi:hypothetical protein